MPFKSPAQKKLMLAAAHTPGGYGGVPQKVATKFAEDSGVKIKKKSKDQRKKRGKKILHGG